MVSMRKLHGASVDEIKEMAKRQEVIVADGVSIGKIVQVEYQAKVRVDKTDIRRSQVDNQASKHKQDDNQSTTRLNTFSKAPPLGSFHPLSKEQQNRR